MLQRAASNAYSWWWASHVRTKQSKWLEQSLLDMGDKVESVLKLITQDGDSFAKRAEMYYKHRPELISFVEESFRAYQSLAERYDHISKELQNANSTLASAFPDQFQYDMDDDDDYVSPRVPKKFQMEKPPNPNIPKAPQKFPTKNIKAIMALTNSKNNASKAAPKSAGHANKIPKSGLTKSEALTEIDKLQKQILTFQTEKEFAKSSYESGYAKYWNIEEEITGMQEKISKLQDEFGISQAIDDDEARTLMAEAAIRSCQDTLAQLQEKQEKGAAEARAERQRIKDAREKLRSLKGELGHGNQTDVSETGVSFNAEDDWSSFEEEAEILGESKDLEMLRDKIKEHFDVGATNSLTVSEMAEKIDELVNKVINLETAVSSQTALIHTLKSETDELQSHIKNLEDDKANLIEGKNDLSDKVSEMENKLKGLHDLDRNFQQHNNSLKTHFSEARSNLDTISKKLHDVKPDDEFNQSSLSQENGKITEVADDHTESLQDIKGEDVNPSTVTKYEDEEGAAQQKSNVESATNDPQVHTQLSLDESKPITLVIGQQEESFSHKEEEQVNSQGIQHQPATLATDETVTPKEVPLEEPVSSTVEEQINPQGTEQQPANEGVTPQEIQPKETLNRAEEPAYPHETEEQLAALPTDEQITQHFQNTASASVPKDEPLTLEDVLQRESVSKPNDGSDTPSSVNRHTQTKKEVDEPDWQQLFMNGLEGKEKVLLAEYTNTLRNYKEAKKRLVELEKKSHLDVSGIEAQLRELKNYNAMKDEEIHSLRQRLNAMQRRLEEFKNAKEKDDLVRNYEPSPPSEDDEDIGVLTVEEQEISEVEAKLRANIDEILEENLDFWMRFSVSFGQIQKFQNGVQDLFSELAKLEKDNETKEGSSHGNAHASLKSDIRPIYKHLREIETELTVWLEQSEKLKEELQRRFSQLCNIQEEIRHAVNAGAEDDDMTFTSYNAAKFQGEVANMQQENNKVADELQAGMDHITSLQVEVERTITRLSDELGLSGTKSQNENQMRSTSRGRVPLRSFIFGVKPQKKKQSIFSCMHPAMMHRRYQNLKADKAP